MTPPKTTTIETKVDDLEALATVDRSGRLGRTAIQVGIPSSLVIIGNWFGRLAGLDLDPGAGIDMPSDVVAAWIGLVTMIVTWHMNRPPSQNPPAEG